MSRRELVRRSLLGVAALLCLAVAILLVLVAVDVARWNDAFRADDVSYRTSPDDPALWTIDAAAPFGLAGRLLAVDDDVAFRRAVRALRGAHLDDPTTYISDPRVALRRNEAQARLEALIASDPVLSRRSRAAGPLGVLGLARFVTETQNREALLSSTVSNFRRAIDLDPSNDEAKVDLELAYQRGRGVQINESASGENPSPGGSGSRGAGSGEPGSGY